MPSLPYAPTSECRACGGEVAKSRYRYSLVETPAQEHVHTGNLCESCFEEVVAVIEG